MNDQSAAGVSSQFALDDLPSFQVHSLLLLRLYWVRFLLSLAPSQLISKVTSPLLGLRRSIGQFKKLWGTVGFFLHSSTIGLTFPVPSPRRSDTSSSVRSVEGSSNAMMWRRGRLAPSDSWVPSTHRQIWSSRQNCPLMPSCSDLNLPSSPPIFITALPSAS